VTWTLAIVAVCRAHGGRGVAAAVKHARHPGDGVRRDRCARGPLLLDEVNAAPTSSTVRTLAEATLALVLFSDASRIDGRTRRRESEIPVRLLSTGPAAHDRARLSSGCGPVRAPVGQRGGHHRRDPGTHRRGPRPGRGHGRAAAAAHPAIAQRRERPQRRRVRPATADAPATESSAGHAGHVVLEEIGWGVVSGAGAGGSRPAS
jgi:sodium/hydrogen antiporter